MDALTQFLNQLLSISGDASPGILQALGAVGIAWIGGLLSSLTPCVYPMIPITIGVVGGIGEKRGSWSEILLKSLSYVFGMALVYSFLGVLAGLTGKVFGTLTNTAGWYLALGIIITLAALTMMDVLPFDPVAIWEKIKERFGAAKTRGSHPIAEREMDLAGAFFLGASSGFIAAPCTTPVLTVILAYIAKTQSIGLGLALMLSFSFGLGTLLLVIAAFAGAMKILPRSGKWMKLIKIGSGLILLVFAEYLIFKAGRQGGLS